MRAVQGLARINRVSATFTLPKLLRPGDPGDPSDPSDPGDSGDSGDPDDSGDSGDLVRCGRPRFGGLTEKNQCPLDGDLRRRSGSHIFWRRPQGIRGRKSHPPPQSRSPGDYGRAEKRAVAQLPDSDAVALASGWAQCISVIAAVNAQ